MFELILKKISYKNYQEALFLIEKALKKHFDLNSPEKRNEYNLLNDLKEKCESELINNVIEVLKNTGKFSCYKEKPVDLEARNYFLESFSRIALEKTSIDDSDAKFIIKILYTKEKQEEINYNIEFDAIKGIEQYEEGAFSRCSLQDGRDCYFVTSPLENDEIDPNKINSGFNRILLKTHRRMGSGTVNKVGIVFDFSNNFHDKELRKLYFYSVIVNLLLKIGSFGLYNSKIIFSFMFEDELDYRIFEKILLNFNAQDDKIHSDNHRRNDKVENIVGRCLTKDINYIEKIKSIVNVINEADVPILILGKSGVGKSFLAQIIHSESIRNKYPFEELNCGGLSEDKLDQKIFGWKKGSFTGAIKDTKGKIARAEGGTLFFDEIDRMPKATRDALLTFIETKKYDIIGSEKKAEADVRLIFGTNKDLKSMIRKGQFEEDFYYRISDRIIEIPALCERINDIELIVQMALSKLNKEKASYISIEPNAVEYLKTYRWPGNTRELIKYLRTLYHDCKGNEKTIITLTQCKNTPFENITAIREDDYEEFVSNMKKLLDNWDDTNGNFLEEILSPLLAKIYLDECYKNLDKKKERAMEIIGISGGNYNRSSLQKFYDKFPDVKKKLGI